MDLKTVLLKCRKPAMMKYMADNPDSFNAAIKLILIEDKPLSWRASWIVENCMTFNDPRVQKYLSDLIKILQNRTDNEQREILKILLRMEIDEEDEGLLFDHCINIWGKLTNQASARIIALKTICKTVSRHPDLRSELKLWTSNHYLETLTPGIKKSAKQLINKYI